MDLNDALGQFDTVEANLNRLEDAWENLMKLIPNGIAFMDDSPQGLLYRQLQHDYEALLSGLRPIDGWSITAIPVDMDTIGQLRMDASEAASFEAQVYAEEQIFAPIKEIREYRIRFKRARRKLLRARLGDVISDVDGILGVLVGRITHREDLDRSLKGPEWDRLRNYISEADRLAGSAPRSGTWGDLQRHLHFAQQCDLLDIEERDWPTVKSELIKLTEHEYEPLPVAVGDLGEIASSRPAGGVSIGLNWEAIDAAGFERLIYDILCSAPGYENVSWAMRTNAPDHGLDISADRVRVDPLSGTSRERVIVQCKHWLTKSISDTDVANTLTRVLHWEPPPIDALVFAASGRFTSDGLHYIVQHNVAGKRPRIEMWADSHLERLLAQRPALVAAHGLR